MGVKLDDKVLGSDVEAVRNKRNPPEYADGFGSNDSEDVEDFWDDLESGFGEDDSWGDAWFEGDDDKGNSGDSSGNSNTSSQSGDNSSWFSTDNPSNQSGNASNTIQTVQGGSSPTQTTVEKVIQASTEGLKGSGKALVVLAKTFKNRSMSDVVLVCRDVLIWGGVSSGVGIFGVIIGKITGVPIASIGGSFLFAGIANVGLSLIGIGVSSVVAIKTGVDSREEQQLTNEVAEVKEGLEEFGDNLEYDEESEEDDDSDDWFLEDEEEEEEDTDEVGEAWWDKPEEPIKEEEKPKEKVEDIKEVVDNIGQVPMLTRELLYNTFKPFFARSSMDFDMNKVYSEDDREFDVIETMVIKALAAANKSKFEETECKLVKCTETKFAYELRVTRILGLNNLKAIEEEVCNYFREDSNDTSVSVTCSIDGDFYKIVVTKGINALVTLGDVLTDADTENYIKDTSHRLPTVIGVDDLGRVRYCDMSKYESIMIAGKARSGKSWSIAAMIVELAAFNTPEDIMFMIVDPKKTSMMKALGRLPHTIGVQDDSNIMEIMKELIDVEAGRRKQILADNKCDTLRELRERANIKLPTIILVLDEAMTIINNIGKSYKEEFFSLMNVIMSQLPYVEIRLLFVPHRATGVIDKTSRTLVQYASIVRGSAEDTKDSLSLDKGIKWTKQLTNVGDTAVKLIDEAEPFYVRATPVATSDTELNTLINNIAKAFYKMGVDIPDMSHLSVCCNRNESEIVEYLGLNNSYVRKAQYSDNVSSNPIDKMSTVDIKADKVQHKSNVYEEPAVNIGFKDLDLDNLDDIDI